MYEINTDAVMLINPAFLCICCLDLIMIFIQREKKTKKKKRTTEITLIVRFLRRFYLPNIWMSIIPLEIISICNDIPELKDR